MTCYFLHDTFQNTLYITETLRKKKPMPFFDTLNIIVLLSAVILWYYFNCVQHNIFSLNSYTITVILLANKCNTIAVTEDP